VRGLGAGAGECVAQQAALRALVRCSSSTPLPHAGRPTSGHC